MDPDKLICLSRWISLCVTLYLYSVWIETSLLSGNYTLCDWINEASSRTVAWYSISLLSEDLNKGSESLQLCSSLTALSGILILVLAESLMLSNLVAESAVGAADIHHGEPTDPLAHLWPSSRALCFSKSFSLQLGSRMVHEWVTFSPVWFSGDSFCRHVHGIVEAVLCDNWRYRCLWRLRRDLI